MSPFILPHILATSIQMVIVYCVTEIIRPDIYITLKPSTHIKYHTHKHIHSHTSDGIECVCVRAICNATICGRLQESTLSSDVYIYTYHPLFPQKSGSMRISQLIFLHEQILLATQGHPQAKLVLQHIYI